MSIPPFKMNIMLDSSPPKSRILVWRLAVGGQAVRQAFFVPKLQTSVGGYDMMHNVTCATAYELTYNMTCDMIYDIIYVMTYDMIYDMTFDMTYDMLYEMIYAVFGYGWDAHPKHAIFNNLYMIYNIQCIHDTHTYIYIYIYIHICI